MTEQMAEQDTGFYTRRRELRDLVEPVHSHILLSSKKNISDKVACKSTYRTTPLQRRLS